MKKLGIVLFLVVILASFASAEKILHIGDSHTAGTYGSELDRLLRGGNNEVLTYGCVAATADNYVKGGRTCDQGSTKNNIATNYVLPSLTDLINSQNPDVVIISLGANYMADPKQSQELADKLGGKTCYWVGPPHSPDDSRLDPFYEWLKQLKGCTVIDSRPYTVFTFTSAEVHFHKLGDEGIQVAKNWACGVFNQLPLNLRGTMTCSPLSLKGTAGASGANTVTQTTSVKKTAIAGCKTLQSCNEVDEVWRTVSSKLSINVGNVWDPSKFIWVTFEQYYNEQKTVTTTTTAGISPLVMQGGDPYLRAFLRMLTKHEGTGAPCPGDSSVSPYQRIVGGTPTRNQNLLGPKDKCKWNYFTVFNQGHPDVLVRLSSTLSSTAAGRYQFVTGTWNRWAKSTPAGANDFSPANQDLAAYQFLEGRNILPILKQIGDNPTSKPDEFKKLWRQIMAPTPDYITKYASNARVKNLKTLEGGKFTGVAGGKDIAGTWASLPYGCYSGQSCNDWNSERFRDTAGLYAQLLKEELGK